MEPDHWVTPIKFYFLILLFSIQRCFFHFVNLIFHSEKTKKKQNISVPPRCLSSEEHGTHRYAKLTRTKFHYVEQGDRNNDLILLLHGYPEFWYSWRFQLKNLSSHYWVVALDMKGFGDSDKPRSQREYDIPTLVGEIHDFITAIGKSRCSLVTHGIGGLVGWYFLHEYPGIVENFVSIASPHPISFLQELSAGRVTYKSWYYFCPIPYFPEMKVMKDNLHVFEKMFGSMVGTRRGNMKQQDIAAYKYTFSRYEDWVGPINYFRTLLLRQGKYSKPLRKSHIPVVFIIGNADPYCTLEMICKSSEFTDNFTLKIVEGGGHFLNQEMPNYVNSIILDFIKTPEPSHDEDSVNRSVLRKVFGAGKTVVNYGNQVSQLLF